MRRLVMSLFLLSLLIMPACSWFSKGTKSDDNKDKEGVEQAPRIIQNIPPPKAPKREPGSLWSEDSHWNTIYSVAPQRSPGDILTIKVNEGLKKRIALTMNLNRGPDEPKVGDEKNDKKKDAKKAESKDENREPASSTAAAKEAKDDTKTLEATILEVLPKGLYKVAVNRAFKIGKDDPYVILEAAVREKEIAIDESVSSDSLLDLKIEAYDEKKNEAKLEANAKNNSKKKEASK